MVVMSANASVDAGTRKKRRHKVVSLRCVTARYTFRTVQPHTHSVSCTAGRGGKKVLQKRSRRHMYQDTCHPQAFSVNDQPPRSKGIAKGRALAFLQWCTKKTKKTKRKMNLSLSPLATLK